MGRKVTTVGELKKALEDFDDNELLFSQVIATDGTVGSMPLEVGHVWSHPEKPVIAMRHELLRSLVFEEII